MVCTRRRRRTFLQKVFVVVDFLGGGRRQVLVGENLGDGLEGNLIARLAGAHVVEGEGFAPVRVAGLHPGGEQIRLPQPRDRVLRGTYVIHSFIHSFIRRLFALTRGTAI